jgi:hypothetical protein
MGFDQTYAKTTLTINTIRDYQIGMRKDRLADLSPYLGQGELPYYKTKISKENEFVNNVFSIVKTKAGVNPENKGFCALPFFIDPWLELVFENKSNDNDKKSDLTIWKTETSSDWNVALMQRLYSRYGKESNYCIRNIFKDKHSKNIADVLNELILIEKNANCNGKNDEQDILFDPEHIYHKVIDSLVKNEMREASDELSRYFGVNRCIRFQGWYSWIAKLPFTWNTADIHDIGKSTLSWRTKLALIHLILFRKDYD